MTGNKLPDDLFELLREQARNDGDREAFCFVTESVDGEAQRSLSYAEIERGAAAVARELDGVKDGVPVVVALSDNHDFVLSVFAIWSLGGVPVPAPAIGRTRVGRERIEHIVADCKAGFALVDASTAERMAGSAGAVVLGSTERLPDVARLAFDRSGELVPFSKRTETGDRVALIQYTSGSTSAPKGVVLSHTNLLANLATIEAAVRQGQSVRMCTWLPLYHDMGLIGTVLYPIFVGGSAAHLRPSYFVKRPYRWLQLIDETRTTLVVAPNFGYQMCVDTHAETRLDGYDLSSLQVALNGSEMIDISTIAAFRERFEPFGLRPEALTACYGMAEASLLISCGDVDTAMRATTLPTGGAGSSTPARGIVSCGRVYGFDLAVVEPESGRRVPDGETGEIWVRGPSVAAGYWDHRTGVAAPFTARTSDGDGGFLRTGDLGTMLNGELYVVGRLKDVMILRGRNLHPHDLEREVRLAHPLLGQAITVVFPAPGMPNSVVAVAEVGARPGQGDEWARVILAVRVAVAREFETNVAGVVLVRHGQIPRTTSGKLQRRRALEIFEGAGFETVAETVDGRIVRGRRDETASTHHDVTADGDGTSIPARAAAVRDGGL